MTSDAQRAANLRNASRSTGPRTADGQATASQNARRHGATAAPLLGRVADWFRVIIDNPDAEPSDLMTPDRKTALAVALAWAEAHLVAARAALEAHLEDPLAAGRDIEIEGVYSSGLRGLLDETRQARGWTKQRRREFDQLTRIILRHVAQRHKTGTSRERLLLRYLREAQGHRNRAFAKWVAYLAEQRNLGALGFIPGSGSLGPVPRLKRKDEFAETNPITTLG